MLILTSRVPSSVALDKIFLPSSRLTLPLHIPLELFKSIVGLARSISLTTLPFSSCANFALISWFLSVLGLKWLPLARR